MRLTEVQWSCTCKSWGLNSNRQQRVILSRTTSCSHCSNSAGLSCKTKWWQHHHDLLLGPDGPLALCGPVRLLQSSLPHSIKAGKKTEHNVSHPERLRKDRNRINIGRVTDRAQIGPQPNAKQLRAREVQCYRLQNLNAFSALYRHLKVQHQIWYWKEYSAARDSRGKP